MVGRKVISRGITAKQETQQKGQEKQNTAQRAQAAREEATADGKNL